MKAVPFSVATVLLAMLGMCRPVATVAQLQDTQDIPILTDATTTQTSPSIAISPIDPKKMLLTNVSTDWINGQMTTFYGADAYVTEDRGITWSGSTQPLGGTPNDGLSTAAIDRFGTYYVLFETPTYGIGWAGSQDGGTSWETAIVEDPPVNEEDPIQNKYYLRGYLLIHANPGSPTGDTKYAAWSEVDVFGDGRIKVKRVGSDPSSSYISNYFEFQKPFGVELATGPYPGGGSAVYAVWAVFEWHYENNEAGFFDELNIGFSRTLDGGQTWATKERLFQTPIKGISYTGLGGGKTMKVNSYPSIAVNQQNGDVYVVWTNQGPPGTNEGDPDVYFIRSEDGGGSWSNPVRVNCDTPGNGKDQWFPQLACDPNTGTIAVAFYDSRELNDRATTYVAISEDRGATWTDLRVSDESWSGDAIPGFGTYAGEYITVAMRGNTVYAVWPDDRSGNMLPYLSTVHIPTTWQVPLAFPEVFAALDLASPGDSIRVNEKPAPYGPFVIDQDNQNVHVVTGVGVPTVDGGSAPYAVRVVGSNAGVEGFAIRGGTTACAYVNGQGAYLQGCTIGLPTSSGTAVEIASGIIEGCTVTMGSTGQGAAILGASEGNPSILDCEINVGNGTGVEGGWPGGEIEGCAIELTEGTGILLHGGAITVANDTIRVTNGAETNTGILSDDDELAADITVTSDYLTVPGGIGIDVRTPEHEVTNCTIDGVKWGVIDQAGGMVRNTIVSNCSLEGFSTGASNLATYCIGWPSGTGSGFGVHSQGTGSVVQDPLYCGLGEEQQYTLRVDSYGNPANNGGHEIGAFPVGCIFGTLAGTTSYEGNGTLMVPGDVWIPVSRSLTLGPGTILEIYERDMKGATVEGDPLRIDLVVDGILNLNGAAGSPVTLRSRQPVPDEGDWNEIHVGTGGRANLSYADVQHATIGIRGNSDAMDIDVSHSQFANNESFDIKMTGKENVVTTLTDNTITVGGGTGIHFTFAGTRTAFTFSGNTITGSSTLSDTGVVLAGDAWNGHAQSPGQDITGNWISGFQSGVAMLVTASGRPRFIANSITDSMRGLELVRTTGPEFEGDIGWVSGNPNTITGNTIGVQCESATSSIFMLPRFRRNVITGNQFGVVTLHHATPDLGVLDPPHDNDPGNNNLSENLDWCIWNRDSLVTVSAQGNYFGPCNGGFPPVCAHGDVSIGGGLCNSPVSFADVPMAALPEKAPGPWLQYGVQPNPMQGVVVIHCALEKTPGPVRIRIFDLAGRLVRDFGPATVEAGGYSVRWTGESATGSRVPNGLYFIQFTGVEGSQQTAKLLVTR